MQNIKSNFTDHNKNIFFFKENRMPFLLFIFWEKYFLFLDDAYFFQTTLTGN